MYFFSVIGKRDCEPILENMKGTNIFSHNYFEEKEITYIVSHSLTLNLLIKLMITIRKQEGDFQMALKHFSFQKKVVKANKL